MVITAFLVVNATSIYTAGDTHINDMQLEALGSDALKMMGTPVNATEDAMMIIHCGLSLNLIISPANRYRFNTTFFNLVNNGKLQETNRHSFFRHIHLPYAIIIQLKVIPSVTPVILTEENIRCEQRNG